MFVVLGNAEVLALFFRPELIPIALASRVSEALAALCFCVEPVSRERSAALTLFLLFLADF